MLFFQRYSDSKVQGFYESVNLSGSANASLHHVSNGENTGIASGNSSGDWVLRSLNFTAEPGKVRRYIYTRNVVFKLLVIIRCSLDMV